MWKDWKSRGAVSLTFLVALALLALVSMASAAGASKRAQRDQVKVAFVTTQKGGDHGVIDDMIRYFNKAKTDFNLNTKYIEALDPSTYNQTLQSLCTAGYQIIIGNFPGLQKPIADIAPSCPQTKFIHIYGDPDKPAIANVQRIGYRYWDGEYLGGMFAAAISQTHKIAYQGGLETPAIAADANAFARGAAKENKQVRVKMVISGSGFADPAKSHDAAAALFAAGYDVVEADDDGTGPIRATHETKNRYALTGQAQDLVKNPKTVPAIIYIRFGKSLYDALAAALKPGWHGGATVVGLKQGIVGLQISPFFKGPARVMAAIRGVKPMINLWSKKIANGTFVVPFDPKWRGA